jgi:hypothetical protein
MADFGTVLNPDNTTLDLYCRSVNQSVGTPFLVFGTCSGLTQVLTPNQKIPLKFVSPQGSTLNGITINTDLNLITINSAGLYLADLNLQANAAPESGSQTVLTVELNGGSVFCDAGYGSTSQYSNLKLTSKVPILVNPDAPTNIQYFIQNVAVSNSASFRYPQLSITKLQ